MGRCAHSQELELDCAGCRLELKAEWELPSCTQNAEHERKAAVESSFEGYFRSCHPCFSVTVFLQSSA